jgi:hypothetical protein
VPLRYRAGSIATTERPGSWLDDSNARWCVVTIRERTRTCEQAPDVAPLQIDRPLNFTVQREPLPTWQSGQCGWIARRPTGTNYLN